MEKKSEEEDNNFFNRINCRNPDTVENDREAVITAREHTKASHMEVKGAATESYAGVIRKPTNKHILSVDIASKTDVRLQFFEICAFLMNVVGLKEDEVEGMRRSVLKGTTAFLQINLRREIDVNTRFKSTWGTFSDDKMTVKIRGMRDTAKMVIVKAPPEGVSKSDVEDALSKIGKLQTKVADDRFAVGVPLFSNKPNGDLKAVVSIDDPTRVPDFLSIKNLRVQLKWPNIRRSRNNRDEDVPLRTVDMGESVTESVTKSPEPNVIRGIDGLSTLAKSHFPTPNEAEVMREDMRKKRTLERTPEFAKRKVSRKVSGNENGDDSNEALEDDLNLKALYEGIEESLSQDIKSKEDSQSKAQEIKTKEDDSESKGKENSNDATDDLEESVSQEEALKPNFSDIKRASSTKRTIPFSHEHELGFQKKRMDKTHEDENHDVNEDVNQQKHEDLNQRAEDIHPKAVSLKGVLEECGIFES